jgi:hypothetical protein
MDDDADVDLELPEDVGCSGKAWSLRKPVLADLAAAARNPAEWGMTKEQHDKVPKSRMSMLSVPIHRRLMSDEPSPPLPVGVLSVDSVTSLADTGWLENTSHGPVAHAEVLSIMMNWAYIVHRLLS